MNRFRTLIVLIGLVVVPTLVLGDDLVLVKLESAQRSVRDGLVTIGDIAQLEGNDPTLISKIKSLDLDECTDHQRSIEVSAEQVKYRILIAGIDQSRFEITGVPRVRVAQVASETRLNQLESLVRREFARQFAITESDVRSTLINEADLERFSAVDLTAMDATIIFPANLPVGKTAVEFEFTDSANMRHEVKLLFRFVVTQEMALAKRKIPRGTTITESDIQIVRRPVSDPKIQQALAFECQGKIATRDIARQTVVKASHVAEPQVASVASQKVGRNDLVKVVHRVGTVTIELPNARVVTPARIGERVEVRNVETGRIVSGILFDATTVVIR